MPLCQALRLLSLLHSFQEHPSSTSHWDSFIWLLKESLLYHFLSSGEGQMMGSCAILSPSSVLLAHSFLIWIIPLLAQTLMLIIFLWKGFFRSPYYSCIFQIIRHVSRQMLFQRAAWRHFAAPRSLKYDVRCSREKRIMGNGLTRVHRWLELLLFPECQSQHLNIIWRAVSAYKNISGGMLWKCSISSDHDAEENKASSVLHIESSIKPL